MRIPRTKTVSGVFSTSVVVWLFLFITKFSLPNYPTIHRVTYEVFVYQPLFVSPDFDSIIVVSLTVLSVILGHLSRFIKIVFFVIPVSLTVVAFTTANEFLAHYLALSLVPLLVTLSLITRKNNEQTRFSYNWRYVFIFFMLVLSTIEILSLFEWSLYAMQGDRTYGQADWNFVNLSNVLFYTSALFVPVLLVVITFGFLFKPIHAILFDNKLRQMNQTPKNASPSNGKLPRLLILAALVFSVLLPSLTLLDSINNGQKDLGVDIRFYHMWLDESLDKSFMLVLQTIWNVNGGDRPLSLLIIYFLAVLNNGDLTAVLRFLPMILSPILVLAVFYTMKQHTNRTTTAIAMLFAALSYQMTVGIYSAFYSNWLAFSTMLLSISFMARTWETRTKSSYMLFLTFFIVTYFMHVFTWIHLLVAVTIYLGISIIVEKQKGAEIKKLKNVILIFSAVIISSVILDIVRSYFSDGGAISTTVTVASSGFPFTGAKLGFEEIGFRWRNIFYNMIVQYGGFISNFLVFALAAIWLFRSRYAQSFDRAVLASLFTASSVMFFATYEIQSRLIYNTPIFIAAAMLFQHYRDSKTKYAVLLYITLSMLNYVIRSITNLPFSLSL